MPAVDPFNVTNDINGPANSFVAVTPHDSTDLTTVSRAIWVGTGGNVVAVTASGSPVTFNNVPDGTLLPIRVSRINSTNTTASDIVALW
jgi:hypothetical protein